MGSNVQLQCLYLLEQCKSVLHLKQVHAFASKTGADSGTLFTGKLLLLAAVTLANALDYALHFLAEFPSPDAFMFNTVIRGLAESPQPYQSFITYAHMKRLSLSPDSFSFAFLFKAAANTRSLSTGSQIHSQSIHYGLDAHLYVATTMVSLYAECGCIASAEKVFGELSHPNVVAWNAMVTAYFRSGDVAGAGQVFDQMPVRNITTWNLMLAGYMKGGKLGEARILFREMERKDQVSWNTMIVGFASHGYFEEAFGFFRELMREGIMPNEVSFTGALSACAQIGAFESGKILHGLIEKTGMNFIMAVSNALLDMYARCGKIDMAKQVFYCDMEKRNIVSWTSMIAALAMQGHGKEALELFHEMMKAGIIPDWITFIAVLYACSHSGLVEQGVELFQSMSCEYGVQPSVEHYGCIVDLYGRAGMLEKAYEFAIQMPIKPNSIIWRTLLGACSIHGNVRLAEDIKMRLAELEPNDSSDYVLLSNVYAKAGKWNDVIDVRKSMNEKSMRKDPGWSAVEVNKVIYSFIASDMRSNVQEEALMKLEEIMSRLRMEGYFPQLANVLHDIEEEEKENAIVRHSEKLAVAFGIARICEEEVIRIVKNLRVCRDCHDVMKLISKQLVRTYICCISFVSACNGSVYLLDNNSPSTTRMNTHCRVSSLLANDAPHEYPYAQEIHHICSISLSSLACLHLQVINIQHPLLLAPSGSSPFQCLTANQLVTEPVPIIKSVKIELPRSIGIEYFHLHNTPEMHRVRVACIHIDGAPPSPGTNGCAIKETREVAGFVQTTPTWLCFSNLHFRHRVSSNPICMGLVRNVTQSAPLKSDLMDDSDAAKTPEWMDALTSNAAGNTAVALSHSDNVKEKDNS
ncbi:hypothetical protein IEQ34_012452 [Dendrobium chrysotoxum]|uniref:DYW domain-containing protein n=1 Tax=Dendrobium chrysotoxum TaxID=161865 RepID=A0AAV7GVA5_DENCH|nr:hypothetical protein IEQ34_012452 [Dendrobium chrysotoxum]